MEKEIEISVVVPVYNSQDSVGLVYEEIKKVLAGKEWELIFVNDFSKDNSWNVLKSISEKDSRVVSVNLARNFGQHNATLCGVKQSCGKYVVFMDDDLQNPPKEILKLLKKIKSGNYRVVYGQYKDKKHGWFRDFCSRSVNYVISRITGMGYNVTSFLLMDKSVADAMKRYNNYNVFLDALIRDNVSNTSVGHVFVEHKERTIGRSNYSFFKLVSYTFDMVFNFTLWPLKIAIILGFFFATISVATALYFLIEYFVNGSAVNGWLSLILSVTFFSGLILFMLGIIGEYLGRIFLVIQEKPQFIIKEVVKKD